MHDFRSYTDRIALAARGVFSVDQPAHRAQRAQEAANLAELDRAYAAEGLDRKAEYRRIAAEMEATMTDGVWARSTKEYAVKCHELDSIMLDAAGSPMICQDAEG